MGPSSSNEVIERQAGRLGSSLMSASLLHRRWFRALIVFGIAALIRIPFQANYLVNWDSVNFALGVESFDLESHQPHPPGYLGYVLLGRLIDWFVGDPVMALTGLSVVAGAAATAGVYLLATRIVSEKSAILAAALFGTSPLVWYYSEVPLTYIVEVALTLPFVILVLEARKQRRETLLLAAAVLLAGMGAVRQTSLVLLLPLLVYGAWAFPWKVRLRCGALLGALVMVWLIPLLVMSGGIGNYLQLSSQLAELTGGATWLGAGAGVLQNIIVVTAALALGMHVALLAIPVYLTTRSIPTPISRANRNLLMVWGLPALLTYLIIHSGQLGYVLILLPIGIIWASEIFTSRFKVPVLRTALIGLLIVVNGIGFFVLPEIAYATVGGGKVSFPEEMATNTLVRRGIQQVSLPRNDAHWDALLQWVQGHEGERIAVLAEPRDGGSFRHLSFYLPETLMYGLGMDRQGTFGHLFTSDEHSTDYSVERLSQVGKTLAIPESIDKLLIPDPRLQEKLEGVLSLDYETLSTGAIVATAEVPTRPIVFIGAAGTPSLELSLPSSEHDTAGLIVAPAACQAFEDDALVFESPAPRQPLIVC